LYHLLRLQGLVIKVYFANHFMHLSNVTSDTPANGMEVHHALCSALAGYPDRHRPKDPDGYLLKVLWRFAAGITGISILSTSLTRLDKIIPSKMLPLAEFGYYTFAAVIYRLTGPVFMAYYPRLTELVSKDNAAGIARA
jgi:O-antigen/teichoic acid export membrane protein